jgi:hypothetical protein
MIRERMTFRNFSTKAIPIKSIIRPVNFYRGSLFSCLVPATWAFLGKGLPGFTISLSTGTFWLGTPGRRLKKGSSGIFSGFYAFFTESVDNCLLPVRMGT